MNVRFARCFCAAICGVCSIGDCRSRRGLSMGTFAVTAATLRHSERGRYSYMLSLNERALAIVRDMIGEAEALGLEAKRLSNGTLLLDAGVNVPGSLEAGRLFAEACMGGLGKVLFCEINYGELSFLAVSVTVGRPTLACMAAQYAGW